LLLLLTPVRVFQTKLDQHQDLGLQLLLKCAGRHLPNPVQ
jgi:hypothetical protein